MQSAHNELLKLKDKQKRDARRYDEQPIGNGDRACCEDRLHEWCVSEQQLGR